MKEQFKLLFYLKKNNPDKSGKTPIMGRITVGRSMVQFSAKISCNPSLWDARSSRLSGKSREAVEINKKIDDLMLSVNSAYNTLVERKKQFNAENVKELFQGGMSSRITLLRLFDCFNEEFKKRIGVDRSRKTIHIYIYARQLLAEFIKKKFNTQDIAFVQLNEQFIRDFRDFLMQEKGLSNETTRNYLIIIKKICKIAYTEGHSDKLYFAHYQIPKRKGSTPKTLSLEDFEKIRDLEISPENNSYITTRDMFLFSCYTGAAYADAVTITKENLTVDNNGALWLKYNRKKNGMPSRVKLLPEATALINKYRDDVRSTLFPKIPYRTVRSNLNSIRVLTGIKKKLTYHAARHTFAFLCISEGVPIESISKMMGHSNISSTQIYAKITDLKISEDMDRLIERRNHQQDKKIV